MRNIKPRSSILRVFFIFLACMLSFQCTSIAKPTQAPLLEPVGDAPVEVGHDQKSELLKKSGQAKLGSKMPFFSGWRMSDSVGNAFNLTKAMKLKKKRYVLNICASWCAPCMVGLQKLADAKERFLAEDVSLIILVADSTSHGQKLYKKFNFSWANVVVDEFKTFALRLAPDQSSKGKESLSLPKTIIFNQEGIVERIIGKEGQDYVDLVLGVDKP